MIENLQDELYQLENKQAKGAKLGANIRQEVEGKKMLKNFLQSTQSMGLRPNQNQIGKKTFYKQKLADFLQKEDVMLTSLKVSSLAC